MQTAYKDERPVMRWKKKKSSSGSSRKSSSRDSCNSSTALAKATPTAAAPESYLVSSDRVSDSTHGIAEKERGVKMLATRTQRFNPEDRREKR